MEGACVVLRMSPLFFRVAVDRKPNTNMSVFGMLHLRELKFIVKIVFTNDVPHTFTHFGFSAMVILSPVWRPLVSLLILLVNHFNPEVMCDLGYLCV